MKSSKLEKIKKDDNLYLFQNYGNRLPVCFTRGDGSYLFDQDNKRYIDFFSGIAVTSLGSNNAALSKALHSQVDKILHTSNWFFNREQIEAAKLISELTFPGKTLFVNSGTEACEAAIKTARRYGMSISPDKFEIISFSGSFHGRTFGAMSATGQEKIRKGFTPLVPGFKFLPFNDINAVKKELKSNKNICAVMTELIQGEGGIKIADQKFVAQLEKLCKKHKVLLIIDEVQTGAGRTGKFCAYQHYGISPDIITFAKGLAGGFPIGAIHTKDAVAALLEPGSHGTTFGGNHLACAAAGAVLKELKKKSFMDKIRKNGDYIQNYIKKLKGKTSCITEVRGMGLHIGIELDRPGMDLVKKALEHGLVINCTSEKVIRIMPSLTIPLSTIKEGLAIFERLIIEEGNKS